MKFLRKSIQKNDFLLLLVITMGAFLLGNIMHDVIMKLTAAKDLANGGEVTTFPLGTMLGAMAMMFTILFSSLQVLASRFDMSVSMGATRKEFFLNELVNQLVRIASTILILAIGSRLEMFKVAKMYPNFPLDVDLSFLFSWKILPIAILVVLGLTFLIGAAFLKFHKHALVFFWILYMVVMIVIMQIGNWVSPFLGLLASVDLPWGILIPAVLAGIGALMLGGSYVIIHKQDVRI